MTFHFTVEQLRWCDNSEDLKQSGSAKVRLNRQAIVKGK